MKNNSGITIEYLNGLFGYTCLLQNNPGKEICITENGVYVCYEIGGIDIKLYLDKTDCNSMATTILLNGTYETEELNMVMRLMSYLDDDAVIFDIGANLGWYGINVQKRLPQSTVYYFEAVPDTYQRLKRNLGLNHVDDRHAMNIGLFNSNTEQEFYYDIVESGASSMADLRGRESTKKVICKMNRLDDFANNEGIQRLDFIKCDVEGSELFVYEGGGKNN